MNLHIFSIHTCVYVCMNIYRLVRALALAGYYVCTRKFRMMIIIVSQLASVPLSERIMEEGEPGQVASPEGLKNIGRRNRAGYTRAVYTTVY